MKEILEITYLDVEDLKNVPKEVQGKVKAQLGKVNPAADKNQLKQIMRKLYCRQLVLPMEKLIAL